MSEPTVSDPAWCRGYDAGYFTGLRIGAGRERAAIVAWLRARPSGYYGGARVASEIERGAHLAGVELICNWCGNLTPLAKMADVSRCDDCAAEIAEAEDE